MHKRRITGCIVIGMLMISLLLPAFALAENGPESAPLNMGSAQNGMVRVRLSSLGNPATIKLTIVGGCSVNGQRALSGGATATVNFNKSTGRLSLTAGGTTTDMGASFTLTRWDTSSSYGVKIAQSREPGNIYPADMQFTVKGSTLYVIAHVFMEDYLYGVLPYEMGNASGLEALKAQAVAARTYTLNAMNKAASSLYDLVDTTADQMYSGTPSGNENCRRAVDETQGIAVKNGSEYTATYYTASNGGQTESVKNAWGIAGPAYLTVKDDPYDLSNPDAQVQTVRISANNPQSSRMAGLLNKKAAAAFGTGASVTAVYAVTPHTPRFAFPSRLYTKMDFEVGYILNGQSASGILSFDIFSELEGSLGMSINTSKNELWSVVERDGEFIISARRYGHGIGMSQRGAMQMARMGYSYDQILGFYYPGCVRVQYTLNDAVIEPEEPQQPAATNQPVPAPETTAWVNTESSGLNLRAAPGTTAKVLLSIPRLETIPIYGQDGDWCQTEYNGQTGYVMRRYLSFGEKPMATAAPSPTPGLITPEPALTARVTTEKGSLNLRKSPKSNGKVLCTIPQDDQVVILELGDTWSKVVYDGIQGYAMTKYLTVMSAPASSPSPSLPMEAMRPLSTPVLALVNTPLSTLNLREGCSTDTRILLEIPRGEYATIHAIGDTWCAVTYGGQSGYCMLQYLEFTLYE